VINYFLLIYFLFYIIGSNTEIGDQYEYYILKMLVANGIECNASRTSYSINNKFIPVGDSGIDLFGIYKSMNYIIQCKYKSTGSVGPADIRHFNQILLKQPDEVQGFFVTTNGYSFRARNEVSNLKSRMVICTDKDLLVNFLKVFEKFEKMKRDISKEFKIENIELDGINDLNLFGINFKGKCKIGSVSVKHSISFSPY